MSQYPEYCNKCTVKGSDKCRRCTHMSDIVAPSNFLPEGAIVDLDENRIDIIGSNGNTGEHYEEILGGQSAPLTPNKPVSSDGSTATYYQLPPNSTELQDLISYRNMNAQLGEIFRACYRYGRVSHSSKKRDIKKIIFYAQAELARMEKYEIELGNQ